MKLSANLGFLYTELPPSERIEAAKAGGFDGVEWPFPYGMEALELRDRLQQAALPLVLINTPLGEQGEPGFAAVAGRQAAFRDGLQRALDLAALTGCAQVHVMAGCVADGDWLPVMVDNLNWALPLARQAGVSLLLEALNRHDMPGYAYHQPQQAVAVLQQLDGGPAGLLFDFYHLAREGLDPLQATRQCLPWIRHAQLADAPHRTRPDLSRPQLAPALGLLRDAGGAGWLGLEYKPGGRTDADLGWQPALRALLHAAGRPT